MEGNVFVSQPGANGRVMVGQQLTGQAFFSQYSTFFYKQQGYSDPFLLSAIGSIIGVAFGIAAMLFVHNVGRRYIPPI